MRKKRRQLLAASRLETVCQLDGQERTSRRESELRGFAGALSFERLRAAHVHLDLLRLGFGLLSQANLQHAFVIVGRDVLSVDGVGQAEAAGEAAILPLDPAI